MRIALYAALIGGLIDASCPRGASARPIAYVTQPAANAIAALDVIRVRVLATISVGEEPVGLVGAPDGRAVYVANRATHSVSVVRTATNTVRETIVIPPPEPTGEPPFLPRQLTVAPDGSRLAVSLDWPDGCPWKPELGTVDLITGAVGVTHLNVGEGQVEHLAFLRDGSLLLALAGGCADYSYYPGFALVPPGAGAAWGWFPLFEARTPVSVGDIAADWGGAYIAISSEDAVEAIDLQALRRIERVVSRIEVGVRPRGLALLGKALYVVNACGRDSSCGGAGSVSVIDTVTNAITAEIAVGRGAQDIALSGDGRTAYVTNTDAGTVSVIGVAAGAVTATIPVARPAQIALVDVPPCADCNRDGVVTIEDILTLVSIAMGTQALATCPAASPQFTGSIAVDTILHAVDDAVNGCVTA